MKISRFSCQRFRDSVSGVGSYKTRITGLITGNAGLIRVVAWLLLFVFIWFLYHQISKRGDIAVQWEQFVQRFKEGHTWVLFLVLGLMPVNWWLELKKFNTLWQQSFQDALRGVLAGIALSILIPSRIGDYGGRAAVAKAGKRASAMSASFVGNMLQLVVTMSLGAWGLLVFWGAWNYQSGIAFVAACFTLLLVFSLPWLVRKYSASRIWKQKRVMEFVAELQRYDSVKVGVCLLFTLLRFVVYSSQYVLLLWFFGIDVPIVKAYAGVSGAFALQALAPLPPPLGLAARTEIALLIWHPYSQNDIAIVAASFSLFVINLVIPSLAGAWVLFRTGIKNSKSIYKP